MGKTRVGIIFGGVSAEHEVSLQSARNILQALDRERFEPVLVGVDKHGRWQRCDPADFLTDADDPSRIALRPSPDVLSLLPGAEHPLRAADGSAVALDVVFPIIHGTGGEDGSLQGLLRIVGLPFVGSGVLGSAAAMDKDASKRLLHEAGIAVAPWACLYAGEAADFDALVDRLGLPLFVKPANQGSSVGVSKVRDRAGFDAALAEAFAYDRKVLVESAIVGREIECAVLGNADAQASTCGEIVLHDEFYSYDTKYISAGGADVVVPARIPLDANDRVRALALRAYRALDCAGLARVDVFLREDGEVVVNEINTLPGFTRISMYPKLWQASGLAYGALITRLLELALERHAAERALKSSHD